MKYYLKINPNNNIIMDCITFPYKNYIEWEGPEITDPISRGWYKLIDGKIIEIPELEKEIKEKNFIIEKKAFEKELINLKDDNKKLKNENKILKNENKILKENEKIIKDESKALKKELKKKNK